MLMGPDGFKHESGDTVFGPDAWYVFHPINQPELLEEVGNTVPYFIGCPSYNRKATLYDMGRPDPAGDELFLVVVAYQTGGISRSRISLNYGDPSKVIEISHRFTSLVRATAWAERKYANYTPPGVEVVPRRKKNRFDIVVLGD